MINKLMQDEYSGGKSALFDFDADTKTAYLCWDVSGGSSENTPRIRLYGSIFPSIVNPGQTTPADFLLMVDDTTATGNTGMAVIPHIYPKMFSRVTSNSGNSRVRIWIAYDGDK